MTAARQTALLSLALVLGFVVALPMTARTATAQNNAKADKAANKTTNKKKKKPAGFKWVNAPRNTPKRLQHTTFRSPSMDLDVGYCIYLPKAYQEKKDARFPVVYYLHGGRPGSEAKAVSLVPMMDEAIESGKTPPVIYVLVNGGPVSHYNYRPIENGLGADVFIKELIPHIDKTYRTIANRKGRALEGFSQGGRGTARLMFRYPELFCSGAPGGGGHATEKHISENNGSEFGRLQFESGDNTWDLARKYAKQDEHQLKVLVYVGTKGFNYENNLQYMEHLRSLEIPFEKLIVKDAPHSAKIIYQKNGVDIMRFHARNFGLLD